MTVEGLSDFIKKKCTKYQSEASIRDFKGKRVAIDANLWFFKTFKIAAKDEYQRIQDFFEEIDGEIVVRTPDHQQLLSRVCQSLLRFAMMWLNHGVTPVFVWDGKSRSSKKKTQEKRMKDVEREKENYLEAVEKLRHASIRDIPIIIKRVRDLGARIYPISRADTEHVRDFASSIGLPTIIAPRDAEVCCATLSRMGKVAGVYSTDSDCYPLLATRMILEKHSSGEVPFFTVVSPHLVMESLGLNEEQFRDFCIMCGVDFNSRVKGLGPVKAYKLIQEHGSLEKIVENVDKDFSCLRYKKCRKYLTPRFFTVEDDILNVDTKMMKDCRDVIHAHGCKGYRDLMSCIEDLSTPEDDDFE